MSVPIVPPNSDVFLTPVASLSKRTSPNTGILILLFLCLLALGSINLYSASKGGSTFYTHLKNMIPAFVALVICGWVVKPRFLQAYAYWIYGFTCILLVAVLLFGSVGGGAQRWLDFGFIRFQPSELAKIAIAITVARFFSANYKEGAYSLKDIWLLMVLVASMSCLIFPQPDFGMAGFIILIALAQVAFVRLDWRSVGYIFGLGVAIVPVLWATLLKDYQKRRIFSFLDPELDPMGAGYNAMQSLTAIGSGKLTGKGFLGGTQTNLNFLPMSDTDFVFSVFAEEHGFIGCALVILLFGGLANVTVNIARQAKDTFNSLLAIGIGSFILMAFTINVAMVLRLFPVKGLPLPFFSYGGSGLITVFAAIGILIALDRDSTKKAVKSD